jgi:unsaturated rhamnogalacturonyl hydrolase
LSLLKLNERAPAPQYVKFTQRAIGSFINERGEIQTYKPGEYQLDALNPGKTVLVLWQLTHEERYRLAAARLYRQFAGQPRTFDGGFWHKERYTNQMWLDGIYMAAPFYAGYAREFGESDTAFEEVAKQIRLMDAHAFDGKSGLLFHGWDAARVQPWANPVTGCSSNFWGRAMGWYLMALVDALDFVPERHPARAQLIAELQKVSAGVVRWQDARTGLWWQVMDQGGRAGNYQEATASAMFVYALAKGANRGYLSPTFRAAAEQGYAGIVSRLIQADGDGKWSLTQCCSVAGLGFKNAAGRDRDGSFDYYVAEPVVSNDLKGVGPFILAGLELSGH